MEDLGTHMSCLTGQQVFRDSHHRKERPVLADLPFSGKSQKSKFICEICKYQFNQQNKTKENRAKQKNILSGPDQKDEKPNKHKAQSIVAV